MPNKTFLANVTFNSQRNDIGDNNTLFNSGNITVNQKATAHTSNRRPFSRPLLKQITPVFIGTVLLVVAFTLVGGVLLAKTQSSIRFARETIIASNEHLNTKYYNKLNEELITLRGILRHLSRT